MITEIIAVLSLIYDYAEAHPEIVKRLAQEAEELLTGHAHDAQTNAGAAAGLAAGLAAMRSNAVQEALRSRGIGDIDKARRAVHSWLAGAGSHNAALLQDPSVLEAIAELLKDTGHPTHPINTQGQ